MATAYSPTLSSALLRRYQIQSKPLVQAALVLTSSWIIALSAQVELRIPFSLVPITLQTLTVLIIGASLGSRRGAAAVVAYLVQGSAGLPFFAGGAAGMIHLFGPTGGYLLGFVVCAYFAGKMAEQNWDRSVWKSFIGFFITQSAIFILGALWLSKFVGLQQALVTGVLPFIPGEIIKTALAAGLFPAAWKWVNQLSPKL